MVRYSAHDVEKWAAFSGDYNPIHFDKGMASSYGMTACPIQGMLALADVKNKISDVVQGKPFSAHISFRDYIVPDTDYEISWDGKRTVTLHRDGQKLITARLKDYVPEQPETGLGKVSTDAQMITCLDEFAHYRAEERKHPDALWSLGDSLLFRDIFNTESPREFTRDLSAKVGVSGLETINDVMSVSLAVQTNHTINVSEQALNISSVKQFSGFSINRGHPSLVLIDEEKVVIEFLVQLVSDNAVTMSSKSTVLIKRK